MIDDIIQYLAPTLEKHKGCTIIDTHPGACLFSTKLHNYLKPKRHILMEPEERYIERFIQPLLDSPDSTYRHTRLSAGEPFKYHSNCAAVFDDPDLMPPREPLGKDDPRLSQLDPSLLFLGNFARAFQGTHHPRLPTELSIAYSWAALRNSMIHRSGRVRMLWWLPEHLKGQLFAPTERWTSAVSVGFALTTLAQEVVGTLPNDRMMNAVVSHRRGPLLRAYADSRIDGSMQVLGMKKPKDRDFLDHPVEAKETEAAKSVVSPFRTTHVSESDLVDSAKMIQARMRGFFHSPGGSVARLTHAHIKTYMGTLKFAHSARAMEKLDRDMSAGRMVPVVDLYLQILEIEAGFKNLEERSSEPEALAGLRDNILEVSNEFESYFDAYGQTMRIFFDMLREEQIALFSNPPLLLKDRAQYYPLQATSKDFFPRVRMMLLDVTPTEEVLSVPDIVDAAEGAAICHMLLKNLFYERALSLPQALDRLAPNAAQDLIPMVPAITDPRKGGRLNPNHLKVRMVNNEMLIGLAKAWAEWPWRPSTLAMELSQPSGEASDDVQEEQIPVE